MIGVPVPTILYTEPRYCEESRLFSSGFLGREAILGGSKEPLLERAVKSGHFHTVFCALAESPNRSLSVHCQKSILILLCFRTVRDKEIQDPGLV